MTSSFSEPVSAALTEQRRESRLQTVYLPCCLRAGPHCGVGLIRNLSATGLMVETALAAEPGSELEYFHESTRWRRARVVWREGARLGLEHVGEPAGQTDLDAAAFPPRAIRIPTSLTGRLWLGGAPVVVGIGNISYRGVLAFGVPPLEPGRLFTLGLAGREFAQTSLRWWADGSAGLKFAEPITLRALTELIERADRMGSGLHFRRHVGELLEVVPANDRHA